MVTCGVGQVICASPVTTTGALGPCCVPPHSAVPPGHAWAPPYALTTWGDGVMARPATATAKAICRAERMRRISHHSAHSARTGCGSLLSHAKDALAYHTCPKFAGCSSLPTTTNRWPALTL